MARSAVRESAPKRSTTASATSPVTGAAHPTACRIVRLPAKRRKAAGISASGMNIYFLVAIWGLWVFVAAGFWLGWQLLRQNGRILLRLDELEKRLEELDFGEADEPTDARSADFSPPDREPAEGMRTEVRAPVHEWDDRSGRFSNHSLTRSRIKRDGLKV